MATAGAVQARRLRRALLLLTMMAPAPLVAQSEALDPAAWGADHVGQPTPDYVTGDECLFCHRDDVGPTWRENAHQRTLRQVARDAPAYAALAAMPGVAAVLAEATIEMGGDQVRRYLKPSGPYGQLALLTTAWLPRATGGGSVRDAANPRWDEARFGERCAGCHTTAVDTTTRAFASPSLDCYTCHGAVDISHAGDTSRMIFAKGRRDPAVVVTSICAQCHVRSGRSRSSGLPYANNFVAGDNLFRDYVVDFEAEQAARLDVADRHVLDNVRAVVVEGSDGVTCLTCHAVHARSSERHRGLRPQAACFVCHAENAPLDQIEPYREHSELCEY